MFKEDVQGKAPCTSYKSRLTHWGSKVKRIIGFEIERNSTREDCIGSLPQKDFRSIIQNFEGLVIIFGHLESKDRERRRGGKVGGKEEGGKGGESGKEGKKGKKEGKKERKESKSERFSGVGENKTRNKSKKNCKPNHRKKPTQKKKRDVC